MKRSRSGQVGFFGSYLSTPPKYRPTSSSTADSELEGCPEPALVELSMISLRIRRAFSRRSTAAVAIGLLLVVLVVLPRLTLLRDHVDVHRHRRQLAEQLRGLVFLRLLLLSVAADCTLGHHATSEREPSPSAPRRARGRQARRARKRGGEGIRSGYYLSRAASRAFGRPGRACGRGRPTGRRPGRG